MIAPKSVNQKVYIDAIRTHDIVFGIGPAGTGKTYLAMAMALAALMKNQVTRMVLCRPAVEAGEKLGFLPGDLAEKVNPYLRPLYDALHDMVDFDRARRMLERGTIEVAPLAFMRGRTLNDSFIILDEAQNTTSEQMKMFLTRLGYGSKAVITGDITQIDLAERQAVGPEGGAHGAARHARNLVRLLQRARRRPPSPGAGGDHRLRGGFGGTARRRCPTTEPNPRRNSGTRGGRAPMRDRRRGRPYAARLRADARRLMRARRGRGVRTIDQWSTTTTFVRALNREFRGKDRPTDVLVVLADSRQSASPNRQRPREPVASGLPAGAGSGDGARRRRDFGRHGAPPGAAARPSRRRLGCARC